MMVCGAADEDDDDDGDDADVADDARADAGAAIDEYEMVKMIKIL